MPPQLLRCDSSITYDLINAHCCGRLPRSIPFIQAFRFDVSGVLPISVFHNRHAPFLYYKHHSSNPTPARIALTSRVYIQRCGSRSAGLFNCNHSRNLFAAFHLPGLRQLRNICGHRAQVGKTKRQAPRLQHAKTSSSVARVPDVEVLQE